MFVCKKCSRYVIKKIFYTFIGESKYKLLFLRKGNDYKNIFCFEKGYISTHVRGEKKDDLDIQTLFLDNPSTRNIKDEYEKKTNDKNNMEEYNICNNNNIITNNKIKNCSHMNTFNSKKLYVKDNINNTIHNNYDEQKENKEEYINPPKEKNNLYNLPYKNNNTPIIDKKKLDEQVVKELHNLIISIKKIDKDKKENIIKYINTLNKKYLKNINKNIIVFFENLDIYMSVNGLLICDIGGEEIFNYINKIKLTNNMDIQKETYDDIEKNNVNRNETFLNMDDVTKEDNININNMFDINYIKEKKKRIYGDNIYPIVVKSEEKEVVPKKKKKKNSNNISQHNNNNKKKCDDYNIINCRNDLGEKTKNHQTNYSNNPKFDYPYNEVEEESNIINVRRQMLIERSSYKKAIEEAEEFVSNLHDLKKITEIQGLCKIYLNWISELEKRIILYKEKNKNKKKKKIFPDFIDDKLLATITVKWTIQYTFNPLKKKYSNNVSTQSKYFEHEYSYQSLFTHIAIKIGEEINNELNLHLLEKKNHLYNYMKTNKNNSSFSHFQKYRIIKQMKHQIGKGHHMRQHAMMGGNNQGMDLNYVDNDKKGTDSCANNNVAIDSCANNNVVIDSCANNNVGIDSWANNNVVIDSWANNNVVIDSCANNHFGINSCDEYYGHTNNHVHIKHDDDNIIEWNSVKKATIGGLLLNMLIENAKMDVDINIAKNEFKNEYKYYLFLHKTAKNNAEDLYEECKYKKELNYQNFYEEESNTLKFIILDKYKKNNSYDNNFKKNYIENKICTNNYDTHDKNVVKQNNGDKDNCANLQEVQPSENKKESKFCQKQREKLMRKEIILYRSKRDRNKIELPVFIHSYVWKNNNWYGVIHMRECCANYLLNNAINSHIPLNYLPMICKPKRWENFEGGMLLLKNNFIRCNIKPLFNLNVCNLNRIKNIVSEIGNVGWKINKEILHYIEYAYIHGITIGKIPLYKNYTLPKYINLKEQNNEEIKKYLLLKEEINRLNKCLISERPTFLQKLAVAKTFKDNDIIYFPHNIDFRGRMYPLSPHLHHMSDDICRSLITFAEQKEIGNKGLFWLKIHLANTFGKDKLSFQKRIQWVDQNINNIKKLTQQPFDNIEFWNMAEKPWQALAVAIDLKNALESPNVSKYKSSIPIQQDGTCNGLQHYAALGKDKYGGKAVNIIPSDEPQDIYSVVLDIVISKIKNDLLNISNSHHNNIISSSINENINKNKKYNNSINNYNNNHNSNCNSNVNKNELASYCFKFDLLKRKVVKQTIMTICYGVTSIGAKNQVKGKIQTMIGKELDKNIINKLSQYIANYIFESISEIFKRAMIIKKWFNNLSKVTNELNIPITWISPIGLPCEQPYRLGNRILVNTPLQSISVISYKNSQLHKNKQRLGFPPNFVHSLDASHLMMTAEKMVIQNNFSFAAVHDSYWAHACNVDIMNQFIRESFITLYNEPILENIYNNFRIRLGKFATKIPSSPEQGELDISLVKDSLYFFS
ncbi:DNA-directed RNA polymerase, putative [Plasmodium reichenowi]|uniref:DNA-directed RNA polymerase n=1 Tax=Plasmodium reichenowi TaxID=5854 RepID=A0A060RUT3_PLARE|nr:DNA-directed RNA polymerase, putative [Plasmodium reichenowi]